MQHEDHGRNDGPDTASGAGTDERFDDDTMLAGAPVVVRRAAGLSAVIGAAASAIAIAYLWRAVDTGSVLDWVLCGVMSLIAGFYLAGLLDSRTPLVVADELGVRIRLGQQWRGLPWEAVAAVEVRPRRSALHDGRLVFRPHSLARALDGLELRGRRHASLNQKIYGGALAVPLGLTTRTSTQGSGAEALAEGLTVLSRGRSEVLVVVPDPDEHEPEAALAVEERDDVAATDAPADGRSTPEPAPHARATTPAPSVTGPSSEAEVAPESAQTAVVETPTPPADAEPDWRPRRSLLGGIGTIVSRVAKGTRNDVDRHDDETPDADPDAPVVDVEDVTDDADVIDDVNGPDDDTALPAAQASSPVLPLRSARPALRAEVTRDVPATALGAAALHDDHSDRRQGLPEGRELRRPGSVDLVFEPVVDGAVRPIARLGDPVEPLVIDDFVTEPAYDPVIGPDLAAARTRVGLTVDELADRTRIRPHVIESIEVDDFAPCGGDVYARGHLRTLARVLGQDPAPLLQKFDDRYATAPINARRVFEAELATGMTGSMRSTVGGPNWGLLVGAVLTLVLVWGLVRLFATEPPALIESPTPVLNGSAGVGDAFPKAEPVPVAKRPLPVMLVATQAGSRVVVRNGEGKVVFAGELVIGERKSLKVDPPVRVRAANAGAVEIRVRGKDRGPVGELGEPGRRTLTRASAR